MTQNAERSQLRGRRRGDIDERVKTNDMRSMIREGLEVMRRGRWVILVVAWVVVAGAAVHAFYFMAPPTYSAHALLMVEHGNASSDEESLGAGVVNPTHVGMTNLENQVLILRQSDRIARETVEKLKTLRGDAAAAGEPTILRGEEGMHTENALVQLLQENWIEVGRDSEKGDAVWISATSPDPGEAALLANLYAKEYVEWSQETSRQSIDGSREFLENQVQARRAELRDLEERIKQMAGDGAIALDTETERTIEQIASLEARLDETRVEERMRRAALASIESELADLGPKLVSRMASDTQGEIDLVQEKIARLQLLAQQARMQANSGGQGADTEELRALDEQIIGLKEHLATISEKYVGDMLAARGIEPQSGSYEGREYIMNLHQRRVAEQVGLSGVAAKASALEDRLRNYERKLASIPEQSMQLAQLKRAQRSTEQLYTRLTQRLQEVEIAAESEIGTAHVIRSAVMPDAPNGIGKRLFIVMGAILGLMLGGLVAVVRHKLDVRIYVPEDLDDLDVPLIGVIPDLEDFVATYFDGAKNTESDAGMVSTALPVLLAPASADAEAFRQLYVSVQFSRPDEMVQSIAVTSAEKGAGKSTTALNLALATAQTGRRTLIIDADLRRPTLHTLLGTTNGPDLQEVLRQEEILNSKQLHAGAVESDEALGSDWPHNGLLETGGAAASSISFRTEIDNLWAITTDTPVDNAGSLLRSRQMRSVLETFREQFDIVIIDTPPVLVASETVLLSTQSDAVVVVASAGQSASDAVEQTIDRLDRVGAPLAGVVLNRFDPTHVFGYSTTLKYIYSGYEYESA